MPHILFLNPSPPFPFPNVQAEIIFERGLFAASANARHHRGAFPIEEDVARPYIVYA